MKLKFLQLRKVLLVAAGLFVGASAWAYDWEQVASYNFEDGSISPFVNSSGSTRWTITNVDDETEDSKVIAFTNSNSLYGNGYAYAVYNFSDLTSDASAVKVEFDFKADGLYSCFSLRDASADTGHNKSTGYGKGGSFVAIGSMRVSSNNVFGVNGAAVSEGSLNTWYHAELIVDIVENKAYYTLKSLTGEVVKAQTEVSFYGTNANACTQFDFFSLSGDNNTETRHIMGAVDNIVVSKHVDASNHSYTINAVCNGTTLAEIATGLCGDGATYSAFVNKVVEYNGQYYVLDDTSVTGYTTATYTMGSTDETKEISYKLDESIIYYIEGETLGQSTANSSCSGGAYCGYFANPVSFLVSDAGTYRLETNVVARNTNSSLEVYTSSSTVSVAQIAKNGSLGDRSCDFVAAAGSTMRVGGPFYGDDKSSPKFQNSLSFDYILIRKVNDTATIPVTIAESGYSTLSSAYDLDFTTTDVTAYVVTEITNDVVILEEVDEVPANTGVILKGTGSNSIPVKVDAAYDGENKLKAAVGATEVGAEEVYILQGGLFHLVTNASTVPAGKAYLLATDVPNEARSLGFQFGDDDDTTGIVEVEKVNVENGAIYNLNGQRVSKPTNGLFIMNGKKVIIK